MNNTKAITDFSNYTAPELGPVAQHIHERMVAKADIFASPTVAMMALDTSVGDYNTKLSARASRATADILAFKNARADLETALGRLGHYVNDVAQGDAVIVERSGFPFYQTQRPANTIAPGAPTNLRLRQGGMSGSILARHKPQRQPSTNEVQISTGNPNTEADWRTVGIFQGQKAEITGLTPGTNIWVRVRTMGLRGVMGDWSDPAQMMVI